MDTGAERPLPLRVLAQGGAMKGYRFYEEFDSSYAKRKRKGQGNVLALDLPEYHNGNGTMDCTAAVYPHPNSAVCGCSTSRDYLRLKCRRIPEAKAREIHPRLFAWLDSFEGEV